MRRPHSTCAATAGGVEFNTSLTIECGQWVDTDDQLDYRLAGRWPIKPYTLNPHPRP